MDIPTAEQILTLTQQLILSIGKILEDFAPEAAEPLPNDPKELEAIVERYEEVGRTVVTLAGVARSLVWQAWP